MSVFVGILTPQIKELVQQLESVQHLDTDYDRKVVELIHLLDAELTRPEVKRRYEAYRNLEAEGSYDSGLYPIASDGFAFAIDPLKDEELFWNTFTRYGFVVGKSVISPALVEETKRRILELANAISGGNFNIEDPSTHENIPVDSNGVSIISRGFFEVYHDDSLAQIRQSLRLYIHHVVLWGETRLWTTFDRYGVKLPGHPESGAGLPLHVDQNPTVHPVFETLQGVLALTDCPAERGTFVGVPGSVQHFMRYRTLTRENYKGEYVELGPISEEEWNLTPQPIPLCSGDIVSWDSRTTHGNTSNKTESARMVAYISTGPERNTRADLVEARMTSFKSGEGANVRDARMHASKKHRYTNLPALQAVRNPEKLTKLGKLLYGFEPYEV